MSRDDHVEFNGTIVAVNGGGYYTIKSELGHTIMAKISGRMRRHRIRIVLGDNVKVGVSPYDPTRGLITYRNR